jgi:TctA family transporter
MIGPSLSGVAVSPVISGGGWAVVFFAITTVSEYEPVKRHHLDIALTGGAAGLVAYLLNQAGSALLPGVVGFVLVVIVLEMLKRSVSADEDRFSIV